MFRWLNPRDVESDEGFSLKCAHRFYYHYIEGDRVLKIMVEPIKDGLEVIFAPQPKWEPPHDGAPLSEEHAHQIEDRVQRALQFMDINNVVRRE